MSFFFPIQPGTHDLQKPTISFKDFVYNDLGEFSRANLERSIPSLVDGLKPSQRKILFCAFEKNLVEDVLVSKFSGYVLDLSVYRHGEQNLDNTIIGMALDYVGRNNVNLLHPSSQFGTRASVCIADRACSCLSMLCTHVLIVVIG